jgi:ELWxxDGT repeat protein
MKKIVPFLFILFPTLILAQAPFVFKNYDLNTGSDNSFPNNYSILNGQIIMSAYNPSNGYELWISDGTLSGSNLLKDIYAGTGNSFPLNLGQVKLNGKIYFNATQSATGTELWESDGTSSGTKLLKDIFPGSASGLTQTTEMTLLNNKIFFIASVSAYGPELWVSDGTDTGTKIIKDIYSGSLGSSIGQLTVFNGKLFFKANNGKDGEELWVSDGTSDGTKLFKDINVGSSGSAINAMTVFNGKLYFKAFTTAAGDELWSSDGTALGTQMLKEINPSTANGFFGDRLVASQDRLFFSGDNGTNGVELWFTDGTADGTKMVNDIKPGVDGSYPTELIDHANTTLVFRASDGSHGYEPWLCNGKTYDTKMIKDIVVGAGSSDPGYFTLYKKHLIFQARNNASEVLLWVSDGTESGTKTIAPPITVTPAALAYTFTFFPFNNSLYFTAGFNDKGYELWSLTDTSLVSGGILPIEPNYNTLRVYPNPSKGMATVEINNAPAKPSDLKLFDMTGRVIINSEMTHKSKEMDLQNLENGEYLLQLKTDQKVYYRKIILLK